MTSELIGKTLGERYHFEHLIGSGTFAEVYLITDQHRRANLAAKVLRSDIARDSALLERFQREATVLARLQHPNIVRYYDIVEADGYRFILMDYIPGHTLDDELRATSEPLRPQRSLNYLTPLASALHYAHNEGIIHRDLKPANILLHENGTLFVTDFGIARLLNVTSQLTLDKTIGTPLYMAPEQITGASVTVATDVYSLGVILYRMYTGRAPFRGDSAGITGSSTASRITYEQVHTQPLLPTEINPRLDLAVQDIIMRCLQKDPSRRYRSISDLYDALAEAVGAPPIAIDDPAEHAVTTPPDAERPDIKLPEWSQFMPQVDQPITYATLADSVEFASTGSTDDIDDFEDVEDEFETLAPAATPPVYTDEPERIEQPFQASKTQPHLENALHEAAQTIMHQSIPAAAPTLANIDRVPEHAYPTPRHLVAPPQPVTITPPPQGYAHEYPPPRRRNWVTIAMLIGGALIALSLCIAAIYLSGGFGSDTPSRNPEADITLSVRPDVSDTTTGTIALSPTRTDSGALIAFDSRRSGNLDIYIANADGSDVRQITGTSGAERGPAWSPDGTQLAFYGAASENSSYDIYVIDINSSSMHNLTSSSSIDDRYPTWSPDGTQIAFHSNAGGDFEIYIINADGTGMHAITDNDADDLGPDWSPDGTQIAYHTSQWDFPYELAVIDLNSGQVRRLTDNDHTNTFPTWSPDGTRIAYNAISSIDASTNIFLIDVDGSDLVQLTDTQDRNAFPDWSPDGTQIIYQRGQPDVSAVYALPVTGGDPIALTDGQSDFLPDWQP